MSPYQGSIYSAHDKERGAISQELADAIQEAEKAFDCPVWSLIHCQAPEPAGELGPAIYQAFLAELRELRACNDKNGVALIVDSPGGTFDDAYRISMLLRRSCSTFRVLVPRMAKSAATLLAMGATELYLGTEAELGPMDVSIEDEFKRLHPAITSVEAFDRLRMGAVDLLLYTNEELYKALRPESKEALLPAAVRFAGDFMRPLADKIDAISYTEQLRNQRVAKEYAVRVLRKAGKEEGAAFEIAERLVTTYPSHEFVIGYEEAAEFLDLAKPNDQQQDALDRLCEVIWQGTDIMIGRLVPTDEQEPAQSHISASG